VESVHIDYFSDVLCVWAYVSQIRLDELKDHFGDQVDVRSHFIPIFGCTAHRIGEGWKDRGGYEGFGRHVREVCGGFPHAAVHPDLYGRSVPSSSAASHHFLKAVQLLEDEFVLQKGSDGRRSILDETAWRVREAFFRENRDISRTRVLLEIAEELKLPIGAIEERLGNGEAMAAMCRDIELQRDFNIEGSPTFLLNEGRQKLYGNLGYKILEANVQELLNRPMGQASWC
jgi:protein-disulfide isomerase-like protein with CxxC motif